MCFAVALADPRERLHQHAHAEVEALEDEEAEEQRRDDAEPQLLEVPLSAPFGLCSVGEGQGCDLVFVGVLVVGGGAAGSASCSSGPSTM